jgi:hypothetical protein
MKKHFSLIVIGLLIFGCSPAVFRMGMSTEEFVKSNRKIELVEASTQRTVYRKVTTAVNQTKSVKFYYFVDDRLVRVDEGVKTPDTNISIQRNK